MKNFHKDKFGDLNRSENWKVNLHFQELKPFWLCFWLMWEVFHSKIIYWWVEKVTILDGLNYDQILRTKLIKYSEKVGKILESFLSSVFLIYRFHRNKGFYMELKIILFLGIFSFIFSFVKTWLLEVDFSQYKLFLETFLLEKYWCYGD